MYSEKEVDERVFGYIERAYEIAKKDMCAKTTFSNDVIIEVAKMIQLEDFRSRENSSH